MTILLLLEHIHNNFLCLLGIIALKDWQFKGNCRPSHFLPGGIYRNQEYDNEMHAFTIKLHTKRGQKEGPSSKRKSFFLNSVS